VCLYIMPGNRIAEAGWRDIGSQAGYSKEEEASVRLWTRLRRWAGTSLHEWRCSPSGHRSVFALPILAFNTLISTTSPALFSSSPKISRIVWPLDVYTAVKTRTSVPAILRIVCSETWAPTSAVPSVCIA
jgi:hypothetical protein